jgi:molybdopterin-containing oxidoreductase family iron-sulfur binding subunit
MLPLQLDGFKLENVPVIVQPGQAVGTGGLALGYGRKAALKKK